MENIIDSLVYIHLKKKRRVQLIHEYCHNNENYVRNIIYNEKQILKMLEPLKFDFIQ